MSAIDLSTIEAGGTVTLTRRTAIVTGVVDEMDDSLETGELGTIAFRDMPGWFDLTGSDPWTVTDHQPATARLPFTKESDRERALVAAVTTIADWQDARYADTASDDDGTEAEALATVEVPRFAALQPGASVVLNETVKPASLAGMRGTVPNPEDIENDHLMVDLGGWLWPCRRSEFDVVTPSSSQAGLAALRYGVVA